MRSLRTLSGRQAAAILAEHGFSVVRRRGSHVIVQRGLGTTAVTVPIPDHREPRTGTLLAIIRQPGVARVEFEE